MLAVAVDTSTRFLSVAVCRDDDTVLHESTILADRAHAERIVDEIDGALAAAGVSLERIDLLAVGHGPGSFTGLRIGVSTMKGLALGADLPLVGVETLDAMIANVHEDGVYCPMLDARMDEVFAAEFRIHAGTRVDERPASVCAPDEWVGPMAGPVICFGEGARIHEDRIRAAHPEATISHELPESPPAAAIAREAIRRYQAGASADAGLVRPLYLRKSQPERLRDAASEKASAP